MDQIQTWPTEARQRHPAQYCSITVDNCEDVEVLRDGLQPPGIMEHCPVWGGINQGVPPGIILNPKDLALNFLRLASRSDAPVGRLNGLRGFPR
jgi:hypothetical protein